MIIQNTPKPFKNDERLYFLHIQKTAGTTFSALLQTYFSAGETCPAYDYLQLFKLSEEQRPAYRYYRGHFGYGLLEYLPQPVRVVTLLRDPIERTLSNLSHIRRYAEHDANRLYHRRNMMTFLKSRHIGIELRNLQTRSLAMPRGGIELYRYWELEDRDLDTAKERLETIAFVGLVERFSESLHLLVYMLGWQPFSTESRLNSAPERFQIADLDNEVIDYLHEINRFDLDLYAFARQLFADRYQAMMAELLERHYEVQMSRHNLIKVSAIKVNMDQPMPGKGWDEFEATGNGRWTNVSDATLDLRLVNDRALQLEFRIITAINQSVLDSFRAYIDDTELALSAVAHPQGGVFLKGTIIPSLINPQRPFTRLRFHTDRVARPCDETPDSTDQRLLGVFISDIRISPA